MPALLILNYDVHDAGRLAAYREVAGPLLAAAGARVVTTTGTVDLGEGAPAGTHTVVWRFPDLEAARAVYDSDAYQAVLGDRLAASTPKLAVLVETVAEH